MPLLTPHVPNGLIDLMKDLAKEVLRDKPENLYEFAAVHFEKQLQQRDGSLDKNYEQFTAFENFFDGQQRFAIPSNSGYICQRPIKIQPIWQPKMSKADVMASFKAMESIHEEDVLTENPYTDEKYENAIYIIQRYYRSYAAKKKIPPSPVLTEVTAAIIIQRTMRRLFSNKIKLKTEGGADHPVKQQQHNGLAQDDVDNVSEAASYTSSSTIQLLADSQEGRENRSSGRREVILDGGADEDDDSSTGSGFKEQTTTTTTTTVTQDEDEELRKPPSEEETSEEPPTEQPTEQPPVAEPEAKVEDNSELEAGATEVEEKSIADENGKSEEVHKEETTLKHPTKTLDVNAGKSIAWFGFSKNDFHKQDTSTAHIGIFPTKIGSYGQQNSIHTDTVELDSNSSVPTQTKHHVVADKSFPLSYPQSLGATPDTLPATSPQPFGASEGNFAVRLQGNAYAQSDTAYPYEPPVQMRKFDPDTGEYFKVYDVFYQDRDDPDFSDSLNESTMEKDSLENEDLDVDSLESNEYVTHVSGIVKREVKPDEDSLNGDVNEVEQEEGAKSGELERGPTYLYGIHPPRTPVMERKSSRNKNLSENKKVRSETDLGVAFKSLTKEDGISRDKSEEELSLESKDSTSDESGVTQIENVVDKHEEAIIESGDGKKLPHDVDVEDVKTEIMSAKDSIQIEPTPSEGDTGPEHELSESKVSKLDLGKVLLVKGQPDKLLHHKIESTPEMKAKPAPASKPGSQDRAEDVSDSEKSSKSGSSDSSRKPGTQILDAAALLIAADRIAKDEAFLKARGSAKDSWMSDTSTIPDANRHKRSLHEDDLPLRVSPKVTSIDEKVLVAKVKASPETLSENMKTSYLDSSIVKDVNEKSPKHEEHTTAVAPSIGTSSSLKVTAPKSPQPHSTRDDFTALYGSYDLNRPASPLPELHEEEVELQPKEVQGLMHFYPGLNVRDIVSEFHQQDSQHSDDRRMGILEHDTTTNADGIEMKKQTEDGEQPLSGSKTKFSKINKGDIKARNEEGIVTKDEQRASTDESDVEKDVPISIVRVTPSEAIKDSSTLAENVRSSQDEVKRDRIISDTKNNDNAEVKNPRSTKTLSNTEVTFEKKLVLDSQSEPVETSVTKNDQLDSLSKETVGETKSKTLAIFKEQKASSNIVSDIQQGSQSELTTSISDLIDAGHTQMDDNQATPSVQATTREQSKLLKGETLSGPYDFRDSIHKDTYDMSKEQLMTSVKDGSLKDSAETSLSKIDTKDVSLKITKKSDESKDSDVTGDSKKEESKSETVEITLKDLDPQPEEKLEMLEEEVKPVIRKLNYAVSPADNAKQITDPEPETQKKALEVSLDKESEDGSDVARVSKVVVSKEPTSTTGEITLKDLDPKLEMLEEEVKPVIRELNYAVSPADNAKQITDPEPETQKKALEVSLGKKSVDGSGSAKVSKIEVSKDPTTTTVEITLKDLDPKLEKLEEEVKPVIAELNYAVSPADNAKQITDPEPETQKKALEVSLDKESEDDSGGAKASKIEVSKEPTSATAEITLKDLNPKLEKKIEMLEEEVRPVIGELKDSVSLVDDAKQITDPEPETQKKALEVSLGKGSEDDSGVAKASKIEVSKEPTSTTAEITLKHVDPKLEKKIEKLEEEVTPVIRELNYAVSPADNAKQITDPEPETQKKALEVSLGKKSVDGSGSAKVSKIEVSKEPTSATAEITLKDLNPKLEKKIEKLEEEVTPVIGELNYTVSPADNAKQITDPEPETQKKALEVSLDKESEDDSGGAKVSKIEVSKEPTSTPAEITLKHLDPKPEKKIEKLEEEVKPVIGELKDSVSLVDDLKQITDPEPETQKKALEVSLGKESEDDSDVAKVSKIEVSQKKALEVSLGKESEDGSGVARVSKVVVSTEPTSTTAEITLKDLDPKLEKKIEKLEEEVTPVIRELNYAVSPADNAKQITDPEPETQKKALEVSLDKESVDGSGSAKVSKIEVSKEPTTTTAEITLKDLDPKLEKKIEKLEEEVRPVIAELNYAVSLVDDAKQITDPEPETQKKALEVSLGIASKNDSDVAKVSKIEVSREPTSTTAEITLKDLDPKLEKKIEKLEEEVRPVIRKLNYAVSPADNAKQITDPEPETQKKALDVSLGKVSEDGSGVARVSKIEVSKEPTSTEIIPKIVDSKLEETLDNNFREEFKSEIGELKSKSVKDAGEITDQEPETKLKILEVPVDKESDSKEVVREEPNVKSYGPKKTVEKLLDEDEELRLNQQHLVPKREIRTESTMLAGHQAIVDRDNMPKDKIMSANIDSDQLGSDRSILEQSPDVKVAKDPEGQDKSKESSDCKTGQQRTLDAPEASSSVIVKQETDTTKISEEGDNTSVDLRPKRSRSDVNVGDEGAVETEIISKDSAYVEDKMLPVDGMSRGFDKSNLPTNEVRVKSSHRDEAIVAKNVFTAVSSEVVKDQDKDINLSVEEEIVPTYRNVSEVKDTDLRGEDTSKDKLVNDDGRIESGLENKDILVEGKKEEISMNIEKKTINTEVIDSKEPLKTEIKSPREPDLKEYSPDFKAPLKGLQEYKPHIRKSSSPKGTSDIDDLTFKNIETKHLERQDPKVDQEEHVVETEAQNKEDGEVISKLTSAETSVQLLAEQSEPHPKDRSPSPSIFEESSLKDALKSYKESPVYRRRHKRHITVGDESELTEDSDDKSDSLEQIKGRTQDESDDSKSPIDPASPNITEAVSLTDALKSYKKNPQFQRRTDHESSKNMEHGSDDSKSPTDLASPNATEELSLTDALKTFKKSIQDETKSQKVENDDDKPLVVEGVRCTLGSKVNIDTHHKWSPTEYKYRHVQKHHVEETDHEKEVTEEFEKSRALQESGIMPAIIHDKVELETEDQRKVQDENKSEDLKKPQIQSHASETVVTKTQSENRTTDPKVQQDPSLKPEARKQESTEERDIDLLSDEKSKHKKLEVDEGEQSGMESILTQESAEETVSGQKISNLEASELKSKILRQENDETEKQIKTDMAEQSAKRIIIGEQSNEAFATKQPKLPEAQDAMESVVKNKNMESALSEDQPVSIVKVTESRSLTQSVKAPTKDDPIRLKESWNKNLINDFIQAERLSYVSPIKVKIIETEDPSNSLASSGHTEVTNCDESNTSADFSSIGKDLDFLEDTIHYLKSATAHLSHSISDDTKAEILKTESLEDSKRSKSSGLESDSEITPTWNAADQDHFEKEAASAVEGIYRKVPEESTKKSTEASDTIDQEKFKSPTKSSEVNKIPDAIRPIVVLHLAEDPVDQENNFDHIEESKTSKVEHKESESGQIKSDNDEAGQKKDRKVDDIKQHDPQIPTVVPSQKSKTKDQDPTISPPSRPATFPSRIRREKPLDEKKVKAIKSKSLDEPEQSKSKAKPVKFDRSHKAASLTDQQNGIEIKGKSVQMGTSKIQPSAEKAKPDAPKPVKTEIQLTDDKKEKKSIKSKTPSTSDLLGRQRSSKTKRDRFGKKGRSMSTNEQAQIQTGFDLEAIKKELLTKKVKTPPQSGKKAKMSGRNGRQKKAEAIEEEIHKESQNIVSKSQSDILEKDDHQGADVRKDQYDEAKSDDQLRDKGVRSNASESEEQEKDLTRIETKKKSPHAPSSFEGRDEEIHIRSSTESEIEKPASKTKESESDSPDFFDNLKEDANQLKDFILQSSATMIQKVFRGYKTRKDLTPSQVDTSDIPEDLKNATIHKKAKEIEPKISEPLFAEKPEVKFDSMDTDKILTEPKTETPEIEKAGVDTFERKVERSSDADLDKSALVIQKAYKGYKTRKNLKEDLVKPKGFQRGTKDISEMKRSEIRIVDEKENVHLLEQEVKTDKKDDQKQTDEPIVIKTTEKSLTEDHFDQESPNLGLFESLKKEVETLKETALQKSATTIQKIFRGYKARKDLKDQKSDRIQKDIKPTDDSADASQHVKISENVGIDQIDKTSQYEMETSQKDSSTKDNLKEGSQKMDESPDEIQFGPLTIFDNVKNDVELFKKNALDKSATTIQKTFRGYRTRKNLENNQITSKLRDDISDVSAETPVPVIKTEKEAYSKEKGKLALHSEEDDLRMHKGESKEKEIDISALNIGNVLDKSATTIQKHFRGYQTRKNIGENINKISTTQMPEKEYEDVKFTSKVLPKTTSQIFESDKKGDTKMDTEMRIEKRKQKDIDLMHTSDNSGTKTADQVSSRKEELSVEKSSKAMINESILKDALDRTEVRSGTAGILRRSKGSLQLNKEFEEYNAQKAMKQQEFKSKNVEERAEMSDDKRDDSELDSPDQVVKTKEQDLDHPPTELESAHSLETDQIYEDTETISGCTTKVNSSESIKTVLDASEMRQKQAIKTEQAQSQEPIPESPPISIPEYKIRAISADAFLDKAASTIQKAYRYYYSRDRKSSVSPKASQRSYSQGAERKLASKESSDSSYESSNFIGPDTSFDLSDVDSTETKSEKVSNIKERISSEASTLVNDNERLDDFELEIPDSPPLGISIHPEIHEPEKLSTKENSLLVPETIRRKRSIMEPTAPPLQDILNAEETLVSDNKPQWYVGDELIIPTDPDENILPTSSSSSSILNPLSSSSSIDKLSSVDARNENLQLTPSINSAVVSTSSLLLANDTQMHHPDTLKHINKPFRAVSATEEEAQAEVATKVNKEDSIKEEKSEELDKNEEETEKEEPKQDTTQDDIVPLAGLETNLEIPTTDPFSPRSASNDTNKKNEEASEEISSELCKNCAVGFHVGCCPNTWTEDTPAEQELSKVTQSQVANAKTEKDDTDASMATEKHFDEIKQFVLMETTSSAGDDSTDEGDKDNTETTDMKDDFKEQRQEEADDNKVSAVDEPITSVVTVIVSQAEEPSTSPKGLPTISLIPPSSEEDTSDSTIEQETNYKTSIEKGRRDIENVNVMEQEKTAEDTSTEVDGKSEENLKKVSDAKDHKTDVELPTNEETEVVDVVQLTDTRSCSKMRAATSDEEKGQIKAGSSDEIGSDTECSVEHVMEIQDKTGLSTHTSEDVKENGDAKIKAKTSKNAPSEDSNTDGDVSIHETIADGDIPNEKVVEKTKMSSVESETSAKAAGDENDKEMKAKELSKDSSSSSASLEGEKKDPDVKCKSPEDGDESVDVNGRTIDSTEEAIVAVKTLSLETSPKHAQSCDDPATNGKDSAETKTVLHRVKSESQDSDSKKSKEIDDQHSADFSNDTDSAIPKVEGSSSFELKSKSVKSEEESKPGEGKAKGSQTNADADNSEELKNQKTEEQIIGKEKMDASEKTKESKEITLKLVEDQVSGTIIHSSKDLEPEKSHSKSTEESKEEVSEEDKGTLYGEKSQEVKLKHDSENAENDNEKQPQSSDEAEKPLIGENNKDISKTTASSEERHAVHQTEKKHSLLQRSKTISREEQDKQAREDFEIAAKLLDVLKHEDSKSILEENETTDASKDDNKEASSTALDQPANKHTSDEKPSPQFDTQIEANLERLIEESQPHIEAKQKSVEPRDLPKKDSSIEVIEKPCTKMIVPRTFDEEESELESTTPMAESSDTNNEYDNVSDNDGIETTLSIPDTLEAMTEKLEQAEATVARMQKRRASEHTSSIDNIDPLLAFGEPICDPIKPMRELQKSSSLEIEDDIVFRKLQRDDTTRESSAQSESVIFGDSSSQLTESEDTFNESLDFQTLKRMNTIAADRSTFKRSNLLLKSVTIDDTVKYIDPEKSTEESGSSFSMDDAISADVRKKMMAYSVSEADSDYYDEGSDHTNRLHDDFNISTALDNFPSSDTDTTIVSAATKIQAGARGFLTRRRLRRASMGTKSSLTDTKTSFGNDAIGESLERLVEEEITKRLPKAQYHRQVGVNSLPSVLRNSDETKSALLSPTHEETTHIDDDSDELKLAELTSTSSTTTLTGGEWASIDGQKDKYNLSTSSENDVNGLLEPEDESAQVSPNLEATLAARRLTLQRGDAMRNDSTPDDDNSNGKQNSAKNIPTSSNRATGTDTVLIHQAATVESMTSTTTERKNYSDAVTSARMEKIKWFAMRQNSMPVQIDSEVFRVLPKHMRKRIKSAEGEMKRRIRLPRD